MPTGTVKWFDIMKRYGFITPDNGGQDIFVHSTALQNAGIRSLMKGQRVSYQLATERRRQKAVDLALIEQAPEECSD
jgi:CspA family cold shock protein